MNKFAVIDIGSNSVRLMLVADGKVLYKRLNTTRLGEGIAQNKFLLDSAIERSALAVKDFYETAKGEGVDRIYAFATAAVRSAENGNVFVKRVKELCGLDVDVIKGETEAEIGVLGAIGKEDGGIIDVGGASTEIVVKKDGKTLYKKSVDIGVVRLKDLCGRDKNSLETVAKEKVKNFQKTPNEVPMYAIGGTATTLASLEIGLKEYDSNRITGSVLTKERLAFWSKKLLSMTVEEIEKFPCMPKGRADVLAGGAVLLLEIMESLGFEKLIVSDRDNLEGYALFKGERV